MSGALLQFFPITFAAAWICWAAAGAIVLRIAPESPGFKVIAQALFLFGTITPSLVALALTARAEGRAATKAWLAQLFRRHVDARWYVFAVVFMPAIKLSAAVVHRIAIGAWPRFGEEPWFLMVAAIAISMWAQAGEEIGWRGFALPRLSARLGLAPASVILGIIWACWHLPLFFVPASDTFGQSFVMWLPAVVALSVVMAWLFWRTGGSLLPVMVLHAAVNNTKDIVPSIIPGAASPFAIRLSLVGAISLALMWVATAYFLSRMPGKSDSAVIWHA